MALNLVPGVSNEERFAQHLLWAEQHADPFTPERATPGRARGARKLRIGYVSPDFRHHALAPFVAPLLERHDRSRFEVFAYSSTPRPDAVTTALRARVETWREIYGMDDAATEAQVRADGIDILVDLAGHTNGNRLGVFARKPAPVQLTMLGYPFSTGMRAMDFRLTDAVADADARAAAWNREQLLVMPDSLWCFRPWPEMPEITPLPAAANGYPTFVSLNNPGKLNDGVLETWAEILTRLPQARLRLMLFRPGPASERVLARLVQLGVEPARIVTHERAPSREFWRQSQASDIALDPFPCNGGATTCESLWLGLPVVALVGDHFVARASCSILSAATLGELACPDRNAYVERACALAQDTAALAGMRAGMRERLRASPLLDETRYVSAFESLLLRAWDQRYPTA
jgi:predicted O-linked N-acetylglucosamine transferase (SPINDLY family)